MRRWLVRTLSLLLVALAPWNVVHVRAHDPGLSTLTLAEASGGFAFRLVIPNEALPESRRAALPRCRGEGVLSLVRQGAPPRPLAASCRDLAGHQTAFEGTLREQGAVVLSLLDELPRGHRSFARVLDLQGAVRLERLLARGHAPLVLAPAMH